MTIAETLRKAGINKVDAEILLARVLQKDRTWLLAHDDAEVHPKQASLFEEMTERRKTGEPVAYIAGEKEFFGRMFTVNTATLIPRPATELLTEQAIHVICGDQVGRIKKIDTGIVAWTEIWGDISAIKLIADVGTGSGCIGITLACELPDISVIATDTSEQALGIARKNARTLDVHTRMTFVVGDAVRPLADITTPFLIVSNPPYIPVGLKLDHDVAAFEPSSALFAGPDGTDVIRKIVTEAKEHPFCRGFMIECREEQVAAVS